MQDPPEAAWWLALLRAPGVGPRRFLTYLDDYGSPAAVFADRGLRSRVGGDLADWLRSPDWDAVERDLAWASEPGHHLVLLHDRGYPSLLKQLADPPPLLFLVGDPDLLSIPRLAIVGSRNPSRQGADNAHAFARDLASRGLGICSGLALGIDAAAHRGALSADGATIAVLGTGPDRVYPASHRDLTHEIAERGLLVSEFVPGTGVRRENFPRRNRIISGLSLGCLVVEAALRSGSLITARAATDQGREVFAIPGSIHNPLAKGCNELIRQGAKLVETATHVLEELGPLLAKGRTVEAAQTPTSACAVRPEELFDPEYRDLLEQLAYEPTSVDSLVERCGLTPGAVSSMLLVLELQGYVESVSGGRYQRRS